MKCRKGEDMICMLNIALGIRIYGMKTFLLYHKRTPKSCKIRLKLIQLEQMFALGILTVVYDFHVLYLQWEQLECLQLRRACSET